MVDHLYKLTTYIVYAHIWTDSFIGYNKGQRAISPGINLVENIRNQRLFFVRHQSALSEKYYWLELEYKKKRDYYQDIYWTFANTSHPFTGTWWVRTVNQDLGLPPTNHQLLGQASVAMAIVSEWSRAAKTLILPNSRIYYKDADCWPHPCTHHPPSRPIPAYQQSASGGKKLIINEHLDPIDWESWPGCGQLVSPITRCPSSAKPAEKLPIVFSIISLWFYS